MRVITSVIFLFISLCANSSVKIYGNDTSILGLERMGVSDIVTSTLYGGSNDLGSASSADCVIKYSLSLERKIYKGVLIPFTTEVMAYSSESKNTASFELDDNIITYLSDMKPDVCPMGTDFTGDYNLVSEKSNEYKSGFDSLINFN